jgi:hypothetical protein
VQSPTRTDPPYVPIRATRWPVRRTPRAVFLAAAVLLAVAVAVGLVHRPSRGQRAADLRGFLLSMQADIESCAGGVGESLTALHAINSGSSHDVATAIRIAETGASNCSPANNELIDNLEGYQVPESLASYHLQRAVTGLVDWAAPHAQQVQADVAHVLAARGPQARSRAEAALRRALARLDAQRSVVDAILGPVIRTLGAHAPPPRLPG